MDRFPDAIIESRNQLPELLNERGLGGEGAVIGVFDGLYAERLLRTWNGVRLYCIDSWISCAGDTDHVGRYHAPQWKLDHAYNETQRRLNSLADRARIYRMRPNDAAKLFPDASLSFAYIDERQGFTAIWDHLVLQRLNNCSCTPPLDFVQGQLVEQSELNRVHHSRSKSHGRESGASAEARTRHIFDALLAAVRPT